MSKFLSVLFIAALVVAIIAVIIMAVKAQFADGFIKGIIGLL